MIHPQRTHIQNTCNFHKPIRNETDHVIEKHKQATQTGISCFDSESNDLHSIQKTNKNRLKCAEPY